jgi:hypothetical protein
MSDKGVRVGDSFAYLGKSLDQLQNQQVGGIPPVLYPQVNLQTPQTNGNAEGSTGIQDSSGNKEGGQE